MINTPKFYSNNYLINKNIKKIQIHLMFRKPHIKWIKIWSKIFFKSINYTKI